MRNSIPSIPGLLLMISAAGFLCAHAGPETGSTDRDLFKATCLRCHAAQDKWRGSGSEKGWKETVARMQKHAEGTRKAFDDQVAARIAAYLAAKHNGSAEVLPKPAGSVSPEQGGDRGSARQEEDDEEDQWA